MSTHPNAPESTQSTGELITQLSEQTSQLVRDEIQLAQSELKETAKHAARGGGMFGAAGSIALYAVGVLLIAAMAALSLVLPLWASALVIGVALLVVAAVLALGGKRQMGQVSAAPRQAIDSVQRDVSTVKGASQS